MRLRLAVLLLVLVAAAAAVGSAGAVENSGLRLSAIGGSDFPERTFALRLPRGAGLANPQVVIRENGKPVSGASVIPAELVDGGLATVLVVDTSESMWGRPIREAMAAARGFAERRSARHQLGVVTFDSTVQTLLPLTADGVQIENALSALPALHEGTHVNDAIARAAGMLRASKVANGTIVLLSDGDDTGSAVSVERAVALARAAHARVFSVGIYRRAFDPESLEQLAVGTGGQFSEAQRLEDLVPIYSRLGFELSGEHLIRYRSLAGPETRVRVTVTVPELDETVETAYTSPELTLPPTPPFQRSTLQSFWRSPVTFAIAVLLAASLIAGALVAIVSQRDSGVRTRVAEFVSIARRTPTAADGDVGGVLSVAGAEPVGRWARFQEELEISEVNVPAARIVVFTLLGTAAAALVLFVLSGLVGVVLALLVPLAVRLYLKRRLDKRRALFAEQLADNLAVVAAALRAGHSLTGALAVVVDEAPEPARREFQRIVAEEQLGVPLEDAVDDVARRMECRDLEQVSIVAAVGRDAGGNTAEVLDRVVDTVRERSELRRLVNTLTAQGRLSRWIVSLLPVALLFAIMLINPGYLEPLFDRTAGRALLVLATLMVISGSLVIRRIVNIRV